MLLFAGPVSNLEVTTPAATALTISWTASGSIDRFEVTYSYTVNRCSASPEAPVTVSITDVSVRERTLSGLNEDSSYTITVSAIRGEASTMATITADTLTAGECIVWSVCFLQFICRLYS